MTKCNRCGQEVEMATATMGVDGMTCEACVAQARVEVEPELTTPAGAMPIQLIIVVVLMGINVLSNFAQGAYLGVAFGVAMIMGIVAGNHGVRKFLLFLAWVGLVLSGFAFLTLLGLGATFGIALGAYSVATSAFTVWTLSHPDVREWMFKTAFKDGL